MDERELVVVARRPKQGKSHSDTTEYLKFKKRPFEELYQRVMRGEYRDAVTVIAALRALTGYR